jgi:hypothetical protein
MAGLLLVHAGNHRAAGRAAEDCQLALVDTPGAVLAGMVDPDHAGELRVAARVAGQPAVGRTPLFGFPLTALRFLAHAGAPKPARAGEHPQDRHAQRQREEEIVARHGDAEQLPGNLVARHELSAQHGLAQLVDREVGVEAGRMALVGAAPPELLDADVERGDAGARQQRQGP